MSRPSKFVAALLLLVGLTGIAGAQTAVSVGRSAFVGGGGVAAGGAIVVNSSIGQALGGATAGGAVKVGVGFLGGGGRVGSGKVFLPVVTRMEALRTNLYLTNQTGGLIEFYNVHTARAGPYVCGCTNIPHGARVLCCSFAPGTYWVHGRYAACTNQEGWAQVVFPAGDVNRVGSCR
jgi:hypothetical protein